MVKPDRKRPIVTRQVEHFRLSERAACQLVGLNRRGYRYKATPKNDRALRERLKTLAAQHLRYGYLLLHGLFKAEGLVVNKERTSRLYTGEGLQVRIKKRKKLQRPHLLHASFFSFVSDLLRHLASSEVSFR